MSIFSKPCTITITFFFCLSIQLHSQNPHLNSSKKGSLSQKSFKTIQDTDKTSGNETSIRFTELNINNKIIEYDSKIHSGTTFDTTISIISHFRLCSLDNFFTIGFTTHSLRNLQNVKYVYNLKGYENIWHYTNASNVKVTYTNLPLGTYKFFVKSYFGKKNEQMTSRCLNVIVSYPWYWNTLSKIFYLLFALAFVCFLCRYYINQREYRKQLEIAKNNEKIKEEKLTLFTKVVHELRTPLMLIISPLKLLQENAMDDNNKDLYQIMRHNSLHILQIVNQLMDIQKIDYSQLKLHFKKNDLISLIKDIMKSFYSIATTKQINFSLESREDNSLKVWVDNVHFEKIIYNLLSNAFKFTPSMGKILIRIDSQTNEGQFKNKHITKFAEIHVFNTGSAIPDQDLNHIFEYFYQGSGHSTSSGSGIGLSLAHDLVILHHGQIEVQNIDTEGVEFTIRIPLGNAHLTHKEIKPQITVPEEEISVKKNVEVAILEKDYLETAEIPEEKEDEQKQKYTILVVDDDEDFCQYIKKELVDYNIVIRNGGNKAWKYILGNHPDVVVTDIFMSDGDGYELCRRIKSNQETDYTPVIILTADTSESAEIKSMELQADRFLTKPFNIHILNGAIEQAIRVREKINGKAHRKEIEYNYNELSIDSADDKLVKKVIEYIKEHIEDVDLSVEKLSQKIGISRVHLNRKLKEILGISPSNLIKSIRMKQAAYLLVNNKVNISEVAYKVGFTSHSYFSFNFHAYFGMSPKEFIIYYSENADKENIKKLLE
jgi:signal transduction histidine kinase/DNA-binding response OmpR family regulator